MLAPYFQALVSGLSVGGIYALIALSFSITFTTTSTLNFSQGEFVSFGAFVGISVLLLLTGTHSLGAMPTTASTGMNYPIALLVAGIISGLIGVLIFIVAVSPFAGKPGMSWVMSTIGFGVLLQSVGLIVWGPAPVNLPAPLGDDVIRILGAGVRPQEIIVLIAAILIMIAFDLLMRRSRIGKAMRAVAY